MTDLELRAFFAARDLRGLRRGCGLPASAVASALGVSAVTLWSWERRRSCPHGLPGERYARVVAGMERHAEVTWDDSDEEGGKP